MKKSRRSGLTLIEVVIVAIIMAVLAATIIPQFSASTKDAKMSNLKFNLHIVRSQLERYKEQHSGVYPPAAANTDLANQLTEKTDQNTKLDPTNGACGPYLQDGIPLNPFNNSNTVAVIQGTAEPTAPTGSTDGWQYNPTTSWFFPNDPEYFRSNGSFANPN